MTRRVLVLFAHPAYQSSRANRALADAVAGMAHVTVHDVYEAYPDLLVDVAREQELLLAHDALVLQHPFYWYSAPALVKEWLDLVLTHGWAYGETSHALAGKIWMSAITAGGQPGAYDSEGMNRFTFEEFLRPFEATAHLCRMVWRAPFILPASRLQDDAALARAAAAYRARILELQRT
jgi:glutathione-regulated potassium-efflux system ancillary protein KefG